MRFALRTMLIAALLAALALPSAAQDAAEGEVVRLYVGPETIDCVGVAPQRCLLVTTDPTQPAEAFYDPIDGFEHAEGTAYVLDILVEPVEDPPADGSSLSYTLVDIVAEVPGGTWTDLAEPERMDPEGEAQGGITVLTDEDWCGLFHAGVGDCVGSLPLTTGMGGLVPQSWASALGVENDPSLEGPSVAPDADFCGLLTGELDACLAVLAPADPPLYLPVIHAEFTLQDYLPE